MTSVESSFYEALSGELEELQRVARFVDSASENEIKAKKNRR
ncbi:MULTISPECIES: hypothetical protein [Enterobacter]|jgi:hypothetical protein|uniref:Uncharacterized protein n=1 Tax=Enterobacter rongchengensis TaxID=3030999 RepID=A0ABV4JIR9_9ENTR|nr:MULTISPECIES: hypothetical protein [Enterobacter]MDL0066803.1 hypothetical protein [Enterobacter chengduensis]MDV0365036.1 hypothetical protein [Enterobacter chengduensis]MDY0421357.1 hypothetical protein [Enterobacter sp. 170250]MEC5766984.1 hypothetical protein [Enterobacter chengduensis]